MVGCGNVASFLPEISLLKYRNLHRVQLCALPLVLENCTEYVKVLDLTGCIFRGSEKNSKIFIQTIDALFAKWYNRARSKGISLIFLQRIMPQ